MPHHPSPQNGAQQIIGATTYLPGVQTVAGGATQQTVELEVEGLAWVVLWVFQGGGPLPCTVEPQFSFRQEPGGVLTDWRPIQAPAVLAVNTPYTVERRFPCRAIRWSITAPAAQDTVIRWALAGSQA